MKKELDIISFEGEILLKDNLVRSSILPHKVVELERDVKILGDTEVEGAIYAHKLEIENGDLNVQGAVFTSLELHIDAKAKGNISFRKTVASGDSITSYANDCKLMFMADVNAKKVTLNHTFVAGSIYGDEITLTNCVVIGGVFATKSLDMKNCVIGTFNATNLYLEGNNYMLLPSGFSSSPIESIAETHMYNLSLADLGGIYKKSKNLVPNTGMVEMDIKADEQKAMLSGEDRTLVVYSYSIAGKVLAADLIDMSRLKNHFLISATAMGSQILKSYDLGFDDDGKKSTVSPEEVANMFFDILSGKIKIDPIDGSFSIRDLSTKSAPTV